MPRRRCATLRAKPWPHDTSTGRWIAHDQCYTCHTDYVWFGTVAAKAKGMRHVLAYYLRLALYVVAVFRDLRSKRVL